MKKIKIAVGLIAIIGLLFISSHCKQKTSQILELKKYPCNSLQGVITKNSIKVDEQISTDGQGSLLIISQQPRTVRLFETGDIEAEDCRLLYQAKVRTENLKGRAYLEMWCHFPGKGEFYSRGLHNALSGSQDWTSTEAYFFLKKGENPDNVKLNLVIDGQGKVWIDDIHLVKGPFE